MLIVSFDAVSSEDLKVLKELPNFKQVINNGVLIKDVESIYPTLTYPAHATIVTGRYPMNHGIVDNTEFKPGDNNPNWFWYRKHIKGETIYDLAKEKGMKTCSIVWPVTAGANIDYNMPEIFCTKPYQNQLIRSALAGSFRYQYDINKKFSHMRRGIKQPELDDYILESTKYTIEKYKPNLILIHFIDVDSNRHHYGYKSKEAMEALKRHDKRLGEILKTLDKNEMMDKSTVIVLGDHSALDVEKLVKINKLLKEKELITLNSKGKIVGYKAISKSLDGSAYIYLKDKKDLETKKIVEKILNENINNGPIEFVLNSNEIKKVGANSEAEFMIEARRGYFFIDDIEGEFIEDINEAEIGKVKHRYKATHGYSPKKENYGTFFIGYGKGFKKGIMKETGKLINHGPTIAKILGVTLKDCDGSAEIDILDLKDIDKQY